MKPFPCRECTKHYWVSDDYSPIDKPVCTACKVREEFKKAGAKVELDTGTAERLSDICHAHTNMKLDVVAGACAVVSQITQKECVKLALVLGSLRLGENEPGKRPSHDRWHTYLEFSEEERHGKQVAASSSGEG